MYQYIYNKIYRVYDTKFNLNMQARPNNLLVACIFIVLSYNNWTIP